MEQTTVALTPVVKPAITIEEALDNWAYFQDLKSKLLKKDDYQDIAGKAFIKKSGWRKVATVFNLTDCILDKNIVKEDGITTYAEFTVQVTAPNGRYSEGWACCSINEGRDFAKRDHDIPATAHTRAKNRAISDLVGGGEVSAEELEGEAPTPYGKCPIHDKPLVKGKYGPYCPTRVRGAKGAQVWCKGVAPVEETPTVEPEPAPEEVEGITPTAEEQGMTLAKFYEIAIKQLDFKTREYIHRALKVTSMDEWKEPLETALDYLAQLQGKTWR